MARTAQPKLLGQLRPANTTAVSLYSPPADTTWIGKALYVCNTTGGALTFRIFYDDDGTTYDETTALYFDAAVAANATVVISDLLCGNVNAGNVGVRTSAGNGINFTLFGVEVA